MIADVVREYIASERYAGPVQSNRASELGHPCLRYLVHLRRDWAKRKLPDVELAEIFREGNDQEAAVRRLLEDAGFEFKKSQQAFFWPDPQISGHIDGMISYRGQRPAWWPSHGGDVPCEIKTCSPWVFASLQTVADLRAASQVWIRKWPDQMQVYLLLTDQPVGVLILKDKTRARIRDLWIELDWDRANDLVERAEEINSHLARGTYPERTEGPYCTTCDFAALCDPPGLHRSGAQCLDDPEVEALLNRRAELAAYLSEYREVDAALRERIPEGVDRIAVGDWIVGGRWIERKESVTPAGRYWRREYCRAGVPAEVAA